MDDYVLDSKEEDEKLLNLGFRYGDDVNGNGYYGWGGCFILKNPSNDEFFIIYMLVDNSYMLALDSIDSMTDNYEQNGYYQHRFDTFDELLDFLEED